MGHRGPKPHPVNLLKLHKSSRAGKRGVILKLDQNRPQRPQWLKGEAKKCWDRIVPELYKCGPSIRLSCEMLTLMCCAWQDYVESREGLENTRSKKTDSKRAMIIETSIGNAMENPLFFTMKRAYDQMFKAAEYFRLTPEDLAGAKKGR